MAKKGDGFILLAVLALILAALYVENNKRQEGLLTLPSETSTTTLPVATTTPTVVTPATNTSGYTKKANITYAQVGGVTLQLDLYVPNIKPTTVTGKYPVVFEIHGGAFEEGDKSVSTYGPYLAKNGIVVAVVNYRLSGQAIFPAAIHDLKGAVRFLRANAEKYNLDPNRFGAIGASAGGNLAALLGTSYGDTTLEGSVGGNLNFGSSVLAYVDLFGPVNLSTIAADRTMYSLKQTNVELKYLGCENWTNCTLAKVASPTTYVTGSDPAAFIIHGAKDTKIPVKQSQDFYNALTKAGVKAKLIIDPKAGHGGPIFNGYNADILSFFKTYIVNNQ